MNLEKKIIYIGKDNNYWRELQKGFLHYFPKMSFSFEQIDGVEEKFISTFFLKIISISPHIIYIDFSINTSDYMYLAQLLRRENSFKNVPIVGILDYLLSTGEGIRQSISVGLSLSYIKSGEFSNTVIQPTYMAFGDEVVIPKFATAKTERQFIVTETFRIGYVGTNYIYLEGNSKLEDGEIIVLEQDVLSKKTLPCNYYEISNISDQNLYHYYNYNFQANYIFVKDKERIDKEELMNMSIEGKEKLDARRKKRKAELEEVRIIISERLERWVSENSSQDYAKISKVLVVDLDLAIYKEKDKRLEDTPYFFRGQTYLVNPEKELKKHVPHIICYQLEQNEELDEGEKYQSIQRKSLLKEKIRKNIGKSNKSRSNVINNFKSLQGIIEVIKKIENYEPYIIVFGESKRDSETLQRDLDYKLAMAFKNGMDFNLISSLLVKFQIKEEEKEIIKLEIVLDKLKKKNYNKYARLNPIDLRPKRIFFDKSDKKAWAYYHHHLTLKEINELEVVFESTRPLSPYTCLEVHSPVHFYMTVVPLDSRSHWNRNETKGRYINRAFIHSIGEKENKQLRQEINASFHDKR